ncbi:MAG: acetamidase/formamidase family protein [Acidimicrobiia bacterium]
MTTHSFEPTRYWSILAAHEPVLAIADGDTVETTTVDAMGQDKSGMKVTEGGNPQTGPFYIEGADRGDTLAVHLDLLRPNREKGFSVTRLAHTVVDPWDVEDFPKEAQLATWNVDLDKWTATLSEPDSIGEITLALSPMLGCFGVSPPGGQGISTATSGPHGGNMDYNGFVEGTTVYFPVSVPGALFFLGDGHAVQGDGEIVGTGIEISFDVRFTTKVIKEKRIRWPRGETESHIFTVGNARPLEQALQHATSEMVRMLIDDFGLSQQRAHTLLGQAVEYQVGNVYDPAYTIVCKLNRALL